MDVKIKFLGAAKSVTGSKYLLQVDDKKILVDCGMFQGQKNFASVTGINYPLIHSKLILL